MFRLAQSNRQDKLFLFLTRASAAVVGGLVFFILLHLTIEASGIFGEISWRQFVFDQGWYPSEQKYNIVPMVFGTILVAGGSFLICVPVATIFSVFSFFMFSKKVKYFLSQFIQMMSGIPSVIYGFWGLVFLVPLVSRIQPPGTSVIAGILTLSVMTFPLMVISVYSILESIPQSQIIQARALGLSDVTVAFQVLFRSIFKEMFGACFLQFGRAVGETMVVLMVCGNIAAIPKTLFEPARTLTSNIALEMAYAMDTHRALLFFCGVSLMVIVALITFTSQKLEGRIS